MILRLLQLLLFFTPVAIFTGSKDNFLIKESILICLILFAIVIYFLEDMFGRPRLPLRIRTGLPAILKFDKISISIFAFVTIEFISVLNAKFLSLVFQTALIHLCFGFVYLFVSNLDSKQKQVLLNTILCAGIIVCIYGIAQYFGYDFFIWASKFGGRPSSSFGNPNFF
ncbi:MAG: hypothetical protein QME68_05255, partial [Elusimicrobiota bacterium]|nr:hypothetical protein [Elusimicrobiota bacterium]